jgi:DNA-binding transcriptional regulator YhcF (GntR family)
MIDIQHDSPTPIHEQITLQIIVHVAWGDLPAGTRLADYRAFAQQLLTNPSQVAQAYADLEGQGVLRKVPAGGMEVIAGADAVCRAHLHDQARQRIRQALRQAQSAGLSEGEIRQTIEQTLTIAPARPLSPTELLTSFKTKR